MNPNQITVSVTDVDRAVRFHRRLDPPWRVWEA